MSEFIAAVVAVGYLTVGQLLIWHGTIAFYRIVVSRFPWLTDPNAGY